MESINEEEIFRVAIDIKLDFKLHLKNVYKQTDKNFSARSRISNNQYQTTNNQ